MSPRLTQTPVIPGVFVLTSRGARIGTKNGPSFRGKTVFWCKERRIKAAGSEALHAIDLYEKFGATEVSVAQQNAPLVDQRMDGYQPNNCR